MSETAASRRATRRRRVAERASGRARYQLTLRAGGADGRKAAARAS